MPDAQIYALQEQDRWYGRVEGEPWLVGPYATEEQALAVARRRARGRLAGDAPRDPGGQVTGKQRDDD